MIGVVEVAHFADQARYRTVELEQQCFADGPLVLQGFHVTSGCIEPGEGRWQIDEGNPVFACHLEWSRRTKRSRLGPTGRNVTAGTNLGGRPASNFARGGEVEIHHLVVVA